MPAFRPTKGIFRPATANPFFQKSGGAKPRQKAAKISDREAAEFNRAKKTYNQKIDREVARVAKRSLGLDWRSMSAEERRATYEQFVRAGIVRPKWTDRVGDFATHRQFRQSMSELKATYRHVQTKAYQREKLRDMRSRLKTAINRGYELPDDVESVIDRVIDHMSEEDIIGFSFRHSDVVATTYQRYKEKSAHEGGIIDEDLRESEINELIDALEEYDHKQLIRKTGLRETIAAYMG